MTLTAYATLALLAGCAQKSEIDASKLPRQGAGAEVEPLTVQNVKELNRLFAAGMTTNEILAHCGRPHGFTVLGDGRIEWSYATTPFPAEEEMSGTYVIEVRLELTNGCVARLNYAYLGAPTGAQQTPLLVRPKNEPGRATDRYGPSLKLFAVSEKPIYDGTFIDTDQFPRLGYIASVPILTISKVKEATSETLVVPDERYENSIVWAITIVLADDDARVLSYATSTNIPSKLFITLNNEPVAAPVLLGPIRAGNIVFRCRDRRVAELLQDALAEMKR